LLIVKQSDANGKSSMAFKTLTPMELRQLEENAAMLERPTDILSWLGKACAPELLVVRDGDAAPMKEPKRTFVDSVDVPMTLDDDENETKALPGS